MFRVLVVDDEPLTRSFLSQKIPSLNNSYTVAACLGDGKEAMDYLLENGPVDLVLTDIKMPVVDGLELSRKIRARFPDMPVVILSGFGDFDFAQQAIKNGVSDYLLKPIVNQELEKLLGSMAVRMAKKRQMQSEQERIGGLFNDAVGWIACQYYQSAIMDQPAEAEDAREMLGALGVKLEETALICLISFKPAELETLAARELGQSAAKSLRNVAASLACGGQGWAFEDEFGNPAVLLPGRERLPACMTAGLEMICGDHIRVASAMISVDMPPRRAWLEAKLALLAPGRDAYVTPASEADRSRLKALEQAAADISTAEMGASAPLFGKFYELCLQVYGPDCPQIRAGALLALMLRGPDPALLKNLGRLSELPPGSFFERLAGLLDISLSGSAAEDSREDHACIVETAKAYIQQNYQEPISLSMVADAIGVSVGYLSSLFHRKAGEPYIKYLTRMRMEAAVRYLEEHPGMLVSDIAQKTGYIATKHFLYVFKKYFGFTPTEYRQTRKS